MKQEKFFKMKKPNKSSPNCEVCKSGLQAFADKSTMHGFQELYYANSMIWKTIWFLVILGSVGVSIYQIIQLAQDTIERPTTSVIQPLAGPTEYPPMRFCYLHWIFWVDWNRTTGLGFDRSSTLYGLGYISTVISESDFNTTETSIRFKSLMEENGFATLLQLYDAISFKDPPGIHFENGMFSNYHWKKQISVNLGMFCYFATTEAIIHALEKTYDSNLITFTFDKNYYHFNSNVISHLEYNRISNDYMGLFLDPFNQNLSEINFTAPPIFNFDGIKENKFGPTSNILQSQITITASLYHWYNTSTQKCNSDQSIASYYMNCNQFCYWTTIRTLNPTSCLGITGATLLNLDTMENVCRFNTSFLINDTIEKGDYWFNNDENRKIYDSQYFNDCITEYCALPCDQWKYSSFSINLEIPIELSHLNMKHVIYVTYPAAGILEMWQLPSQTWSSIVGNVGGIVGLWLGGSVMSILQMIYLLCFTNCEGRSLFPQQ